MPTVHVLAVQYHQQENKQRTHDQLHSDQHSNLCMQSVTERVSGFM